MNEESRNNSDTFVDDIFTETANQYLHNSQYVGSVWNSFFSFSEHDGANLDIENHSVQDDDDDDETNYNFLCSTHRRSDSTTQIVQPIQSRLERWIWFFSSIFSFFVKKKDM